MLSKYSIFKTTATSAAAAAATTTTATTTKVQQVNKMQYLILMEFTGSIYYEKMCQF